MIVYYYIPKKKAKDTILCGLKLSKWYDTEFDIKGFKGKAISCLLTPKDEKKKYKSKDYVCIKIDRDIEGLYVIEKLFSEMNDKANYINSLIPAKDYKLGMYRKPRILITETIFCDDISKLNKKMDFPVMYENSEKLYLENVFSFFKDDNTFYDKALLGYFSKNMDKFVIDERNDKYTVYSYKGIKYVIKD